MTKGFYNLTSGMLSQTRRLNVVGNNMTNVSTPGYKTEYYTDTTFDEVMINLVGNKDKSGSQPIGEQSYILAPDEAYVDYSQGGFEQTGLNLDFAIQGEGFFAIQTANGVEYTRGGSFSLDEEGYLYLPDHGRVLSITGQPLQLSTDNITADGYGRISTADGQYLVKNESGLFGANGQAAAAAGQTPVLWKWTENSNVDMIREMTLMMTSQRALQSAAQVLKLYDGILTKATSEVGRM